jgi:hypothetical protein
MAVEQGSITINEIVLVELDSDPTAGGGFAAPIGSIAFLGNQVNSTLWKKTGSGATAWTPLGTVTSVGLSLPAIFSVSGSPVTASGTLATTLATQAGGQVWAGPELGSAAAAPTFRALGMNDVPRGHAFEDFLFGSYAVDNAYTFAAVANSGSSDVEAASTGNDYAGMHVLSTLNSASSNPLIHGFGGNNKIALGNKAFSWEARVRISASSTNAQNFTTRIGFMDGVATGAPVNGVFFSYNHGTNSGNWVATSTSASTSSNVNSTVAMTANQWYILRAVVNAAGTSISFYIDDALIGSVATNIPTVAMRPVFKHEKTNGTQARLAYCDYFQWQVSK